VISESVLLELQRATHATVQVLATRLVDLDLTASDLNALGNLADGAPRTVSELGAAVGSRPTTLTGVLDRLERRGLVTRSPRPGDRRAVQIELTADGRATAALVATALADLEREALAGLPAGSVESARAVLRALAKVGG
jgi:MarR family transcriptional regulator, organic hydroperoxide resistance regulator